MKKTVALLIVLLSVIGIVYAQHGAPGGGGETYLCMWSDKANDCIGGYANYCICVKE
mgnify:CR=1 FL=1